MNYYHHHFISELQLIYPIPLHLMEQERIVRVIMRPQWHSSHSVTIEVYRFIAEGLK